MKAIFVATILCIALVNCDSNININFANLFNGWGSSSSPSPTPSPTSYWPTPAPSASRDAAAYRLVQVPKASTASNAASSNFFARTLSGLYLDTGYIDQVYAGNSDANTFAQLARFNSASNLQGYLSSGIFGNVIRPAWGASGIWNTSQSITAENIQISYQSHKTNASPAAIRIVAVPTVAGQDLRTTFVNQIAPIYLSFPSLSGIAGGVSESGSFVVVAFFDSLVDLNDYLASGNFSKYIDPKWKASSAFDSSKTYSFTNFDVDFDTNPGQSGTWANAERIVRIPFTSAGANDVAAFFTKYIKPLYLNTGYLQSIRGGFSLTSPNYFVVSAKFATLTNLTRYLASGKFDAYIAPTWRAASFFNSSLPITFDNFPIQVNSNPYDMSVMAERIITVPLKAGMGKQALQTLVNDIIPIYLQTGFVSSVIGGLAVNQPDSLIYIVRFASTNNLASYLATNTFSNLVAPKWVSTGSYDSTMAFKQESFSLNL